MKINLAALVLGGGVLLSAGVVTSTAEARTLTGMGSFTPFPNYSSQHCVNEVWGAAVNVCGKTLSHMFFDTPVDGAGNHTITAWSYSHNGGYGSFTCRAESIQGPGGNWGFWGAWDTFNPGGQEARNFSVFVGNGNSRRLVCINVPHGRGLASLVYNP